VEKPVRSDINNCFTGARLAVSLLGSLAIPPGVSVEFINLRQLSCYNFDGTEPTGNSFTAPNLFRFVQIVYYSLIFRQSSHITPNQWSYNMTARPQTDHPDSKYVKKEIMYAVTVIALVIGFVGGVIFSSSSVPPQSADNHNHQPGPAQQGAPAAPPAMTPEQANTILNLENEVAKNPKNTAAWVELGNVYYDTDKADKAIRAYNKSLELSPNDPNVITDLGVMYRRAGQPEKALEAFDQAAKIDPMHQQSLFNKGIVYMYDLHDTNNAIRNWEELLKLNPDATAPTGQPLKEMIESLKKSK